MKTEICNDANINDFLLINQLTFLNESNKHLENIKIRDSSLKEVRELSILKEGESTAKKNISAYYQGYLDGLHPYEAIAKSDIKYDDIRIVYNKHLNHKLYTDAQLHGNELFDEANNIISLSKNLLDEIYSNETDLILNMSKEHFLNLRGLLIKDLNKLEAFTNRLILIIQTEKPSYYNEQEQNQKINEFEKIINNLIKHIQEYLDEFTSYLIML